DRSRMFVVCGVLVVVSGWGRERRGWRRGLGMWCSCVRGERFVGGGVLGGTPGGADASGRSFLCTTGCRRRARRETPRWRERGWRLGWRRGLSCFSVWLARWRRQRMEEIWQKSSCCGGWVGWRDSRSSWWKMLKVASHSLGRVGNWEQRPCLREFWEALFLPWG